MRGHWRPLLVQISILASMVVVNMMDTRLYTAIISLSLIVIPTVVWTVAGVLLWTSNQDPTIESLSDAADDMLTTAINSTVAAGIGLTVLLRLIGIITIPIGGPITVGLGYIVVAMSLPAIRKLTIWRTVWRPAIQRRQELPSDGDGQNSGAA